MEEKNSETIQEVNLSERESWLLKRTNWKPEELESKIAEQQEKFAGLLSKENAIELLARSFFQTEQINENKPKEVFSTLEALTKAKPLKNINVIARVWQVYAPKSFERKNSSKGLVCNLIIKDSTGNANLVLWDDSINQILEGKISRNTLLKIQNAQIRSNNPLELSLGYSSEIKPISAQEARNIYPNFIQPEENNKPTRSIEELVDGMLDVDLHARLLSAGKLSTFQKTANNSKQTIGMVCDGLISDGQKAIRLVCWDENARILTNTKLGSAIKVEGGYLKTDAKTNRLEVHLGWKGILVVNTTENGIVQKQQLWQTAYPKSTINKLSEGSVCLLDAKILDLMSIRIILKCSQCGTRVIEGTGSCPECNSFELKALLILKGMIEDDTGAINITFFDNQALEVLGFSQLKIDPQTALELKREYIIGSEFSLVVATRKNPNDSVLEVTAKHIISQPNSTQTTIEK